MERDIGVLYKRYYSELYRYVYVITVNKHDAEDIVHNTFVKAMKGISRFRGDSSIKTWLFTIAYNECMNYYRKPNSLDLDAIVVVTEDDIEKKLCIKEDVEQVFRFIQAQGEPIKTLLSLRLLEEYSFSEIGEIINKSEVWCRVTFFRKKKKMMDELGRDINGFPGNEREEYGNDERDEL